METSDNGVGTKRYRYVDGYLADSPPTREEYVVVRKTPRGVWLVADCTYNTPPLDSAHSVKELRDEWGAKFVLDGAGRRHAHEADAWARDSYRIRKARQIQHAKAAIERAEAALHWLSTGAMPEPEGFCFNLTSRPPEY